MTKVIMKKIKENLYYVSRGVVGFSLNKKEVIFLSNLLSEELKGSKEKKKEKKIEPNAKFIGGVKLEKGKLVIVKNIK